VLIPLNLANYDHVIVPLRFKAQAGPPVQLRTDCRRGQLVNRHSTGSAPYIPSFHWIRDLYTVIPLDPRLI
jgi:hypothetical protein